MTSPLAIWARPAERLPSLVESALAKREPEWRLRDEEATRNGQKTKPHHPAGYGVNNQHAECGTQARYRSGCRCGPCRAVNADKSREARERKRAVRPPRVERHGVYRYTLGCRCLECVEGARAVWRENQRLRAEKRRVGDLERQRASALSEKRNMEQARDALRGGGL